MKVFDMGKNITWPPRLPSRCNRQKTVTLTEAEARRVYEYLDGPSPLDPLEKGLADKIAIGLDLPYLPRPRRA